MSRRFGRKTGHPAVREGKVPRLSEAGAAGEGLDLVLAARPDLAGEVERIVHAARGRDPAGFVAGLPASDPAGFAVLAEVVPGAYVMSAAVRARLGYRGQEPRPIDPAPDPEAEALLAPVIARGPIYRPTPGRPAPGRVMGAGFAGLGGPHVAVTARNAGEAFSRLQPDANPPPSGPSGGGAGRSPRRAAAAA